MQRIQTTAEQTRAVDIFTSAFATDPINGYFFSTYAAKKSFFSTCVKHMKQHTYVLEGKAAALYYKNHETDKNSLWQYFKSPMSFFRMIYDTSFDKIKELVVCGDDLEKLTKQKLAAIPNYYYIYLLSVDPKHQGESLGSRMLSEIISKADQDKLPVVLEASSERNKKLYNRFGFQELGAVNTRDPMVKFTLMMRPVSK